MTNGLFAASKVMRRTLLPVLLTALSLPAAHAFDELNDAQSLVYTHPHLSNTNDGQVINYQYQAESSDMDDVIDSATITINTTVENDDKRNVVVDFLSSERHLPLPPFKGYRGNPIIIAMLEHISQSMGNDTGGGALYFRNRIRDALASDKAMLEETTARFDDKDVKAHTLTFSPFVNDPYLKGNPLISGAEFTIEISDSVPAGVVSISVAANHEDESFIRRLSARPE